MENPIEAWSAFQKMWMNALESNRPPKDGTRATESDPFSSLKSAMGMGMGTPPWQGVSNFSHLFNVFGAYTRLYDAWSRTANAENAEDASGATEQMFGAWREIVEDVVARTTSMMTFGLGEMGKRYGVESSNLIEEVLSSSDIFKDLYLDFFKPWQESASKLYRRFLDASTRKPSPESVDEFHKAWFETYEETMGRFVKIPSVGPSRQKHDLVLKAIDSLFRWQGATMEFTLQMQIPGQEAMESLSGRLAALSTGQATKEQFHEFYDDLIKGVESRTLKMFKSERFTSAMRSTLSSSMEYYEITQKLIEDQLQGTPIVTRTEMDEVEAELVALKRKVRQHEALIEKMLSKTEESRRKP